MEISFITNIGNLTLANGYGVAGFNVVTSLQRLGHTVPFASETAPVEIAFCQPDYSDWSNPDAYHIQYTPWESDEVPEEWIEAFNENCDEVWTPSPLVAQWYKDAGIVKPIFVYEHGIDHMWARKRRQRDGVLKFLHMGEPAPRKGGQMAMEAFRAVFGDRTDVSLTIKAWNRSDIRVYSKRGKSILGSPHRLYNNVETVYDELEPEALVRMVHEHDVLIYPGWGEGFGLIPLQALATGMPTICTEAWAPYKRFLDPKLSLGSRLVNSPWPQVHTGRMFEPSKEDLHFALKEVEENFDYHAGKAYKNSFGVHAEYDWDNLTEAAFDRIVTKFG